MEAHTGEFGAVASQCHDEGSISAVVVGGRPYGDELAFLGALHAAGTDAYVIHSPPEAHLDAADPWRGGEGTRRVEAARQAQDARPDANVEHIDVDIVISGAAAATRVPPPAAEPLQEGDVLTRPR